MTRLTITENNVLFNKQFEFQAKHSVELAISELLDAILNEKYTIAVFIDLPKAVNTVNHKILVNWISVASKIKSLSWFDGCLSERKLYIHVAKQMASLHNRACGVRQGSILGPLLFLLYINDLFKASNITPIMVADDTNLFCSNKYIKTVFSKMNFEQRHFMKWLKTNKLSINVGTTNLRLFYSYTYLYIISCCSHWWKVKLDAVYNLN